jgi:hypothetical protein
MRTFEEPVAGENRFVAGAWTPNRGVIADQDRQNHGRLRPDLTDPFDERTLIAVGLFSHKSLDWHERQV